VLDQDVGEGVTRELAGKVRVLLDKQVGDAVTFALPIGALRSA
jgi:hypothetical protein